jgi:hypothetical protein
MIFRRLLGMPTTGKKNIDSAESGDRHPHTPDCQPTGSSRKAVRSAAPIVDRMPPVRGGLPICPSLKKALRPVQMGIYVGSNYWVNMHEMDGA